MNYERIYNEFIADRRAKEADIIASGEYTEKHHIIPRSLGGGDEPENLIALVWRDHFFAHICLAKQHGGHQYGAVSLLLGRSRYGRMPSKKEKYFRALCAEKKGKATKELFTDDAWRENHALLTSIATKKALNRPDVRKKHIEGLHAAAARLGYKNFKHDAHVIAREKHLAKHEGHVISRERYFAKQAFSLDCSKRMKQRYADGEIMGFKKANPMHDEEIKQMVLETRKLMDKKNPDRYREYAQNRKYATGGSHHMAKRVINLDTGEVFGSGKDAGQHYGVIGAAITNACNGKAKTSCGYHWAYAD